MHFIFKSTFTFQGGRDGSVVRATHSHPRWQLTASCKYNTRDSNALSWPLPVPAGRRAFPHRDTLTLFTIITRRSFKKSVITFNLTLYKGKLYVKIFFFYFKLCFQTGSHGARSSPKLSLSLRMALNSWSSALPRTPKFQIIGLSHHAQPQASF